MPPLSGFFAKLTLLTAGVQEATVWLCERGTARQPADVGVDEQNLCLCVLGRGEAKRARAVRHLDLLLPAAFLVLITVSLGLMGEPVFQLAQQAATQLFSRETYIQAVFAAAQGAK